MESHEKAQLPEISNAINLDNSPSNEKGAYSGSPPPPPPTDKYPEEKVPVDAKYDAKETIDKIPVVSSPTTDKYPEEKVTTDAKYDAKEKNWRDEKVCTQ